MIEVLDDLIPKTLARNMEYVLMNADFPWYLNSDTVGHMDDDGLPYSTCMKDTRTLDSKQFTHHLFKGAGNYSQFYHLVTPFIVLLEKYTGKDHFSKLRRIKANLIPKDKDYPQDYYNYPHTDSTDEPGESLLYYVNDSDGDTFIFNESRFKEAKSLTIDKRITPKRGRCVYFDSDYYHAGSPPKKNDFRVVINFLFNK